MSSAPIIALPFHDWRKGEREGFRTRDGHLLQEFQRHRSVSLTVVVNRPTSRVERLLRREPARVAGTLVERRDISGHTMLITRAAEDVLVIDVATPDVMGPIRDPRRWWFQIFERPAVIELILAGIETAGAAGAASVAWVPTVAPLAAALRPRRFVFDSLDNWLIHPALRQQATRARAAYGVLLPMADEVFVSAAASAAALRPFAAATILPNGVDPVQFAGTHPRPRDLPTGIVVGYAGKIAQRVDAALVRDVASRLPTVTFVFVGPILDRGVGRQLARSPNVVLLGDRHYQHLAGYVQHFDVAWIPHRVGEGETGGDPIKLYEYWAAGRPVVSTPIDGVEQWAPALRIAGDADGAADAILQMLGAPTVGIVPPDRHWAAIADRLLGPLHLELV